MSSFDFQQGELLLIDKPLEWTSFDVVNKIRYAVKRHLGVKKIKVGHAGTLDPLATGLLLVCTGRNTKKINEFTGLDKTYDGIITLGGTTDSFDLECEVRPDEKAPQLTEELIKNAAQSLVGLQDQVPPAFSAKRINGKKAYELARAGRVVEMKSHAIEVLGFEITHVEPHESLPGGWNCHFKIHCSKGTYIRSMARDLGLALDCGGYLSALRRTSIGPYSLEDARNLAEFITEVDQANS
ncbi:tRNA pseudouridine(55) synthase TruB [bacterium SCSIO 12741]|nr:tRNA pseudouridine(55) synthase TruB [bacterium SCSIO 12741]